MVTTSGIVSSNATVTRLQSTPSTLYYYCGKVIMDGITVSDVHYLVKV